MNDNVNMDKKNSKGLADNDEKSFASLIILYETNKIIYTYYKSNYDHQGKIYNSKKIEELLKYRPQQQEIDDFYSYLLNFWDIFIEKIPGVKHYVDICNDKKAASAYRNKDNGGLLYFRSIGLPRLIKAIFETQLRLGLKLEEVIEYFSQVEMCISKEPWINIMWDIKTQTMVMKYKSIIFHMLIFLIKKELLTPKEYDTLIKNFALANDYEINEANQKLVNIHSIL